MNSATVRSLLLRGMLVGLAAGLVAFALSYLLGEPPLRAALVFEEAHSTDPGPEAVSRAMQESVGLATGVLVFATALGGIAALAYCFALGRIGRFGARATAALVAGGAFVTIGLVPFLKYPANPPAVSDPATLNQRTALYVLMIALSVLLGSAAVIVGKRLAPRHGNWNATVRAGVGYLAAVTLAMVLLPNVDEMPDGFPVSVVWDFRLASLAVQAGLWAAFGLLFGAAAERLLEPRTPATAGARAVGEPSAG
ncbi:CbtA family protein [Kitasatospora sp. NPDC059327]|uniref:CbtA family protein n=1 Tax=Kitasatospora sp. NPDC059327 TaxID=3346803 RepID=UPI0036B64350